jgi:uncharacterized protein YndB with AHSA1/START domain
VNPIKAIISLFAVLLLGVVGIGFALPGTWQASRSITIDAAPEELYRYVSSVEAWSRWTPMPFVTGDASGPLEGVGSRLYWDDPQWGQGEWTLTEATPPTHMAYEVAVENGALRTWGEVWLEPGAAGTRLTWTERGDFGWNPLLSWMALGMERMQGEEMQKSLDDLIELIELIEAG